MLKLVTPPVVPLPLPVPVVAVTSPAAAGPSRSCPTDPDRRSGGTRRPPRRCRSPMTSTRIGSWTDRRETIVSRPRSRRRPGTGRPWRWDLVLAGALAWWALAAVRIVRFHRRAPGRRADAGGVAGRGRRAGRAAGPAAPAVGCLVPGDLPPMLWAIGLRRVRLLVPARLWATLGDDAADVAAAPRAGPPEAPRSLGPLARAGDRRALLVAPGRLVDPPRLARGRGTVLRRLGRLGDAPRGQDLCRRTRGGPRVRLRCPDRAGLRPPRPRIGNGHVSSLKRRLRMIVQRQDPQRTLLGRTTRRGWASPPCSCPWRRAGDRRMTETSRRRRRQRSASGVIRARTPRHRGRHRNTRR